MLGLPFCDMGQWFSKRSGVWSTMPMVSRHPRDDRSKIPPRSKRDTTSIIFFYSSENRHRLAHAKMLDSRYVFKNPLSLHIISVTVWRLLTTFYHFSHDCPDLSGNTNCNWKSRVKSSRVPIKLRKTQYVCTNRFD